MDRSNEGGEIGIYIPEQMDWEVVYPRLIKTAKSIGVPDTDLMDFVHTTLLVFFEDEKHLGFDPRKISPALSLEEGLSRFLIGVLRFRGIDYFRALGRRRSRFESIEGRTNDHDRPFEDRPLEGKHKELVKKIGSQECDLIAAESLAIMRRELIALVPGDATAIGVINSTVDITGGGRVNQELACLVLGDPGETQEIVNAIKRIRRKAVSKEQKTEGRNHGRQEQRRHRRSALQAPTCSA